MVLRFGFAVLLIGASACAFQSETGADAEREKDVYAIYSLLFTNTKTSHGADNNERYLIAEATATSWPSAPTPQCITPPADRRLEFKEVKDDFDLRKSKPRQLIRALTIQKPYELIDADEVKAFMKARTAVPHPEPPNERFQGVADFFTLTDVFFNQRRTLALTHLSSWCGGLCGQWQWRVFEKTADGKWEGRDWITCFTMAEGLPTRWMGDERQILLPAGRPAGLSRPTSAQILR